MRALILAGGAGTRLRPLTYRWPKSVIPVVGKPLLVHQIELLKRYGITEIILALNYLPEEVKKVLGDGRELGVKIYYSVEKTPLGTGGAVKNAAAFFDQEPLMVLNGDIINELDLSAVIDFYHHNKALLVIVLTPVADPLHYGMVLAGPDGRIEKFLEKPARHEITSNHINAGTYILDPKIFKYWQKTAEFSFERELFPALLAAGQPCFGYVNQNYWMDLGSPAKYLQTHFDVMQGKIRLTPAGRKITAKVWAGTGTKFADPQARPAGPAVLGKNCRILKGAIIGELTTLGDNVQIGAGSRVEKSIIMTGSRIGAGVVVKNSIIGAEVVLEDDVVIESGVVLAHQSLIKKGSRLGGNLL